MSLQVHFVALLEILLKGAVLLILTATVLLVLRRASAANQHAVLVGGFAVLLLLPLSLVLSPQWSLLEAHSATGTAINVQVNSLNLERDAAQTPLGIEPVLQVASTRLPILQSALVGLWAVGATLVLLRRIAGSIRLRMVTSAARKAPEPIVKLACELAHELKLSLRTEVRMSDEHLPPLTWGTLRPVIILPRDAAEWSEYRLRVVLRHEFAHIERYDALTRLLAQLACAVHWPNPLAWYATKKMRLLQERAADDLVLESGVDATEYADELIANIRCSSASMRLPGPALAMAQPSTLRLRVCALLDHSTDRRSLRPMVKCGSVAIAAMLLLASGLAQVADEGSANDEVNARGGALTEKDGPRTPEELAMRYVAAVQGKDAQAIRGLIAPAIYREATEAEKAYIEDAWVQAPLSQASAFSAVPEVRTTTMKPADFMQDPDWKWSVKPSIRIGIIANPEKRRFDAALTAAKIDGYYFLIGPRPPDATLTSDTNADEQDNKREVLPDPLGGAPVLIDAEQTSFQNGVAIGTGGAKLTFQDVSMSARRIEYNPQTKVFVAEGDLHFIWGDDEITGTGSLEYNLVTKKVRIVGPHRIIQR